MGQAAIPLAMLGAGGLGSLGSIFAPEGQELSSFEGGALDPRTQAGNLTKYMESYLNMALDEARQPVSVRTTVAPLAQFSGGGLPFDIGAPAIDPNRADASLRTLQPFGGQLSPWPTPDDLNKTPEELGYDPPGQRTPDPDDDPGINFPPGDDGLPGPYDPPIPRPVPGDDPYGRSRAGIPTLDGPPAEGVSGAYDLDQFGATAEISDLDQAQGAIELLLQQLERG